jgi:hypothetical protein
MLKKILLTLTIVSTNANALDCNSPSIYRLSGARFGQMTSSELDFWSRPQSKETVCFDEKAYEKDFTLLKKIKHLKDEGYLDSSNCLTEKELVEKDSGDLFDVMMATLQKPMNIFAIQNQSTGEVVKVILTNSDKNSFRAENALNAKDKFELAGITIASSVIGVMAERKLFAGQHDKLLHSNYGALINIGSNLASYAVIEEMGVGDKLKLNRKQKKMAILLTGTLVGTLVAYGKERFYDYYRQKYHTYDPHLKGDMGATMLGGGALTPLMIQFKTDW